MPARKNGAASKPMPISDAPMLVLSALGRRQKAALTPDAAPRSSSATKPIIIDCCSGAAMFMRNALTVYTKLAERYSGCSGVRNMNSVENPCVSTMAFTKPNFLAKGGEASVATPMTMFAMPRIGPLMESPTPYCAFSHAVISGTTMPAPKATMALARMYFMMTLADFLGIISPSLDSRVCKRRCHDFLPDLSSVLFWVFLRVFDSVILSMNSVELRLSAASVT